MMTAVDFYRGVSALGGLIFATAGYLKATEPIYELGFLIVIGLMLGLMSVRVAVARSAR